MIRTYEDVTPAVLKVMERTADPRLREIMTALVRHLHGFVIETRLTEAEFRAATAILAEMGRLTTEFTSGIRTDGRFAWRVVARLPPEQR